MQNKGEQHSFEAARSRVETMHVGTLEGHASDFASSFRIIIHLADALDERASRQSWYQIPK